MNIAATISINAPVATNEPDPITDPANRLRSRFVRVAYDDQPYNSIWTATDGPSDALGVLYHVAVSPTSRLPEDVTGLDMWRSALQSSIDISYEFLRPWIYGYTPGWYYLRVLAGTPECDVHFVPAVFQGFPPPSVPTPVPLPSPSPPSTTRPPRT